MGELFAEVFAFVAAAFLLGLFVGFLFWRWRRCSMGGEEFRALISELARLRQRTADLAARPAAEPPGETATAAAAAAAGAELSTVRTAAERLERALASERERAAGLAARLEGAEAQVAFLQRRLTELAVADTSSPALARPPQVALPPGPVPPPNGH